MNTYYRILGDKTWSVDSACFVSSVPEDEEGRVQTLFNGNSLMNADSLREWLDANSFPLGELTPPEELLAEEQRRAASESASILSARMQRTLVQAETFTGVEFATFAKAGLFDTWAAGTGYVKGNRIVHEGVVYEVQQPVTAQAHQPPGSAGMLAVYRPLSLDGGGEEPDGSLTNPYAFISGMDVRTGKYYTFEGKTYLAKADMTPCTWNPGTPGLWQWELAA